MISYTIDPNSSVIYFTLTGNTTPDELFDQVDEMLIDPHLPDELRMVADATQLLTRFSLTQLTTIAQRMRTISAIVKKKITVNVVTDSPRIRMATTMMGTLMDITPFPIRIRAFSSECEACEELLAG